MLARTIFDYAEPGRSTTVRVRTLRSGYRTENGRFIFAGMPAAKQIVDLSHETLFIHIPDNDERRIVRYHGRRMKFLKLVTR